MRLGTQLLERLRYPDVNATAPQPNSLILSLSLSLSLSPSLPPSLSLPLSLCLSVCLLSVSVCLQHYTVILAAVRAVCNCVPALPAPLTKVVRVIPLERTAELAV